MGELVVTVGKPSPKFQLHCTMVPVGDADDEPSKLTRSEQITMNVNLASGA
jgi:hypothetical protein